MHDSEFDAILDDAVGVQVQESLNRGSAVHTKRFACGC
jgi:hypothetical protein